MYEEKYQEKYYYLLVLHQMCLHHPLGVVFVIWGAWCMFRTWLFHGILAHWRWLTHHFLDLNWKPACHYYLDHWRPSNRLVMFFMMATSPCTIGGALGMLEEGVQPLMAFCFLDCCMEDLS